MRASKSKIRIGSLTPADQDAGSVLFAGRDLLVASAGGGAVLALAPGPPAAAHLALLGYDRVLLLRNTRANHSMLAH